MTEQSIRATIVNHVAVDIAAPPDAVWQTVLDEYVEARKFREIGYVIEPLDDPTAWLGGYRMRFEQDGAVVDDRTCLFSEFDSNARRLSIFADYLSAPGGMVVYATYHVAETADGSRYHLDCHSTLNVDRPAGAGPNETAAAIGAMRDKFDAALIAYVESVKTTLEAQR